MLTSLEHEAEWFAVWRYSITGFAPFAHIAVNAACCMNM